MLFNKREEKRTKHRKDRYRRTWGERLHKFLFFIGLTIAFKGLKGWIGSKKKRFAQ